MHLLGPVSLSNARSAQPRAWQGLEDSWFWTRGRLGLPRFSGRDTIVGHLFLQE